MADSFSARCPSVGVYPAEFGSFIRRGTPSWEVGARARGGKFVAVTDPRAGTRHS